MAVGIIMKGERERKLIRAVTLEWIKKDPAMAREMADAINEFTKADLHKSGKTRGDNGYISVRAPQELLLVLKHFLPGFGDKMEDMRLLAKEFPDLVLCRG
jgi:hypothetical protein